MTAPDVAALTKAVLSLGYQDIVAIQRDAEAIIAALAAQGWRITSADALDAALARERRLREALDDHWPEAGTEPDDTPTLSCSCGWDSEPWRKGSLNWPEHVLAALAETEAKP